MDIRDRAGLKRFAAERLEGAEYSPRKLILIHTGVTLLLSLLLEAVTYYLTWRIGQTGGLSGLGARTNLSAIQSVLQIAVTLALTFWEFGILYAALGLARGKETKPDALTEGFRRFGPLLRLQLLRGLILVGVGMACMYVGAILYSLTPFADPVNAKLEILLTDVSVTDIYAVLELVPLEELLPMLVPMLVIGGILVLAVGVPLLYRFRMAEYIVFDNHAMGAMAALKMSSRLMKGNRMALFRLDLSFWWFYVLQAAIMSVGYGDALLYMFGVDVPLSPAVAFFGSLLLHMVCQLIFYRQFRAKVATTYAVAFDVLGQTPESQPPVPYNNF